MMTSKPNDSHFKLAKKIYATLAADYPGAVQPITELSRNFAKHEEFIVCAYKAFNFDKVNNLATAATAKEKTPDALFLQNDIFYFVEFKAGKNVNRSDIRQKIHEGINTLYQYCVIKKLATREEFIHLRFKYAVIDRQEDFGERATFAKVLQSSAHHYSLKNLEGLLVEQTRVCSTPQSTLNLFRKISQGVVTSIVYVEKNGHKLKVFQAPDD